MWIGAFVAATLIVGCSKSRPSEELLSAYSEESAMAHYLTQPERSLAILDSAVIIKNLSPERADYLRAIILSSGNSSDNGGIEICQRLIDEEAWKSISDEDEAKSFQVDIYRLMATMQTSTGNRLAVLRYSKEGAEIAHGIEMLRGDEADFMGRIGFVLCQSGQVQEGLEILERAQELAKSDGTWSSLITYLNNAKKQYHVLEDQGQHEKARKIVEEALGCIEGFDDALPGIKFVPQGIISDTLAREEFKDFFRVTYYSYLARNSAEENDLEAAATWIQRVHELPQSSNPAITLSLIRPYILLGEYGAAQDLVNSGKELLAGEEVTEDYLSLLKDEMEMSVRRGQDSQTKVLADQIIALSDSLKSSQFQQMLAEQAAQCQLQDERQRRMDAEHKLLTASLALVILVITTGGIFLLLYIKRIRARLKELRRRYAKAKKELEAITGEVKEFDEPKTQEEIYKRAVELVKDEQLFKDSTLDINALAKLVPTNRSYLSAAINAQSKMNFRSWLAHYRIEYAKQVLLSNPEITNDGLAEECGFDNRTSLHRQFKSLENMTPSEWIKAQKASR